MDHARTWVPRVVALFGFALFALAAPAGPYWLDSGELSASGVGLGVAHPTGFPLYMVLVKLASFVPIGELAFRVNLLSAACASLAILWICRLVSEVCRGDAAALIGSIAAGATLALSMTFFRQATVAEVYAPTAAMVAAALLLLQRVASGAGARDGIALAVVCGLGLALHVTFALLAAPVVALLGLRLYRGARWVLITPAVVLLIALGSYAYLPVRAAAQPHPSIQWAQTERAGHLARHMTGASIRDAHGEQMQSPRPQVWTRNAERFFTDAAEQLVFALVAALVGGVLLLVQRRGRWLGGALVFLAAADATYAFWINPMGLVDLQNGVLFAVAVCALAGAGVALFARLFGRAAPFGGAVAAVVMMTPPALVTWSQDGWAASSGDLPRAVAEAGLEDTPIGGVAMVESDSMAAGLIWLTAAEGARPDVAVIVWQRVREGWRARRLMARNRRHARQAWFDGRPIAWDLNGRGPPRGTRAVIGAPMSAVVAEARPGAEGDIAAAASELARIYRLRDGRAWRDRAARVSLAQSLNALGRAAMARDQLGLAEQIYDAAIAAAPQFPRVLINRGTVAAARGDVAGAIRFTERGLAEAPNHRVGLVNLSRYYLSQGRDDDARATVERVRALDPNHPSGLALLAALEARAGRLERAADLVERALALDPRNRDALELAPQLP